MTLPLKWSRLPGSDTENRALWQPAEDNFLQLAQRFPLLPGSDNFQRVPQARVYNSAAISVANNSVQALTFDSEIYDFVPSGVSEQHSTSSATGRLTCRVPGLYTITGQIQFNEVVSTGVRQLRIRLNGATTICFVNQPGSSVDDVYLLASTEYRLVVDDYVELLAYQNSGAARNVAANNHYSAQFMFSWRSP